ncbi:1-acyl-sn-glycerol-3-phosphate acyltransferase, partial [Pseudomonas sp. CCC2.2]|nr:1-acyl-sn-glycerol-3-phosphate acyltransferase [Pseudomonas sp. CCC2.2]
TLDDLPQLMEQCREQMRECIEAMDRELLAEQKRRLPPVPADKTTASNPNL